MPSFVEFFIVKVKSLGTQDKSKLLIVGSFYNKPMGSEENTRKNKNSILHIG